MLSQRKSLFFFFFNSTFLLISSGTYSWSRQETPPANILQGFAGVTSFGLRGPAK